MFEGGSQPRLSENCFFFQFSIFICCFFFVLVFEGMGGAHVSFSWGWRWRPYLFFSGREGLIVYSLEGVAPHYPRGITWSFKVQMLIEEYQFKIMLYFLQRIHACSKDNSMESYCTFLEKYNSLSKGLLCILKVSPLCGNLQKYHTLPPGLLCIMKATFSNECHTLLKGILCIHVYTYI